MWTVLFGKVFEQWLCEQEEGLQEKMLANLLNLQHFGPPRSGFLRFRPGASGYSALCG